MKEKTFFVCSECGCSVSNWVGRCPECGMWNTMEEEIPAPKRADGTAPRIAPREISLQTIADIDVPNYMRVTSGTGELDRVLGGGIVAGSVVLLCGEPGIGKSTLLLQICSSLCQRQKVLYVSGEESRGQIKLRAERLGVGKGDLYLISETDLDTILAATEKLHPDILIVDSIQTIYSAKSRSMAGSIAQVRECAASFIALAKSNGPAVFLVGHVNKEGGISGPKILEHMVDAVLYFEGDRHQSYRIIRAMKNRYGSTNEIGVFDMTDEGLREVPNPSEVLLNDRAEVSSGSCIGCAMEGTRPLITEIQALVCPTVFPAPRRTADGFDYNRMCLLLAVLERRLTLRYSANDVYLNIAGGIRLNEPAADLAVACALISGILDRALPSDLIAFGEVGLAGEVRPVAHVEQRVNEAVRLGFRKILIPKRSMTERLRVPDGVELIGVSHIAGILPYLAKPERRNDGK